MDLTGLGYSVVCPKMHNNNLGSTLLFLKQIFNDLRWVASHKAIVRDIPVNKGLGPDYRVPTDSDAHDNDCSGFDACALLY